MKSARLRVLLAGTESLSLIGFLFLSSHLFGSSLAADSTLYGFFDVPEYGALEVWLAIALSLGAYWLLQSLGLRRGTFWAVALVGLAAQLPAVLAHNLVDWPQLLARETLFSSGSSTLGTILPFLSSIVLLVVAHRTIDVRRLTAILNEKGADEPEIVRYIGGLLLVLAVMIVASLLLTLGTVSLGAAVGVQDQWLERSPWTVLTIGVGAIVLLAIFLFVWLRDREQI